MTNAAPVALTFRVSLTERIFVTLAAIFMGAIALFMLIIAIGGLFSIFFLGVFLFFVAGVMIALTWLVAKEAVSRWRLYARLEGGTLTALLPRRRGFIDQPRDRVPLALADIDRIETRYEAFASNGVTTRQQAYMIVKRDGERLLLGADREWVPPFFCRLADAIADRAGVSIVDLGMVDGDAGFMLVAGQSTPDWETPSLSAPEIALRHHRRARTAAILTGLVFLVLIAQYFSNR